MNQLKDIVESPRELAIRLAIADINCLKNSDS